MPGERGGISDGAGERGAEVTLKPAVDIPRIVIAGTSSNVGKTTVAAGLIAALRRRGLTVQPFKCGPDYIDPTYHERAAGRPCRNLDTWMLSPTQLRESFARACADVDIAVIEGVMGLYDGSDWQHEQGSTAQIAKLLDAPVLLVLDISGAARSAAAQVLGYRNFDPALRIRGVVLNFAGSERHAQGCAVAIADTTSLPMVGWLPRALQLRIPERHLGLVPGPEQLDSAALIEELAAAVDARFNLSEVVTIARQALPEAHHDATATCDDRASAAVSAEGRIASPDTRRQEVRSQNLRPVIAVARDEAFCFYYPENLELLSAEGAVIEFFSPLRGERPGAAAAGVYLGGGYPELHGAALASNTGLWSLLQELHARDAPIYAECGGFMVLTRGLTDTEGHYWPMGGLLPGVTNMSGKLAALGYRHATALRTNLLVEEGDSLRGHEFRYSAWVRDDLLKGAEEGAQQDPAAAWQVRGARPDSPVDVAGYARGNLLASYLHVHFGQRPEVARRFVERLRQGGGQ